MKMPFSIVQVMVMGLMAVALTPPLWLIGVGRRQLGEGPIAVGEDGPMAVGDGRRQLEDDLFDNPLTRM